MDLCYYSRYENEYIFLNTAAFFILLQLKKQTYWSCYTFLFLGANHKNDLMNKDGEIIVIEDDADDQELLEHVFNKLNVTNEIIFFPTGFEALEYLQLPETRPFLILSDINLPMLDGFELRDRIFQNREISKKCIPYVFFTTAANEKAVSTAYALSAQGFFKKPVHVFELESIIEAILTYWRHCYAPNHFKPS